MISEHTHTDIQGISKVLGQTSGVRSPQQSKEKIHIYMYISTNSFPGTLQRCVDLSPSDFYLWGHLKTLVCSASFENEEMPHHHIFYACPTIHTYPRTFARVQHFMVRHVHAYMDSVGGHFEHLLT
jgi:hypothetical protein